MKDKEFIDVLKLGTFYSPANKHYNYKGSVVCDRCQRTNLKTCLGYKTTDLCLLCAQSVENMMDKVEPTLPKPYPPLKPDRPRTLMLQTQFIPLTRMHQAQFMTDMHQDQFKDYREL